MLFDIVQDHWFIYEDSDWEGHGPYYTKFHEIALGTLWYWRYNFDYNDWKQGDVSSAKHLNGFKLIEDKKLVERLDIQYAKFLLTSKE